MFIVAGMHIPIHFRPGGDGVPKTIYNGVHTKRTARHILLSGMEPHDDDAHDQYLQINGLAFAVLAVVFSGAWRRSTRYPRDQRLFSTLVLFNAFMLIADTGMWVFSGHSGATAGILLRTSTVLYYLIHPLPCLLWRLYADLQLNRVLCVADPAWLARPSGCPSSVLVIVSLRTGFLFAFTTATPMLAARE